MPFMRNASLSDKGLMAEWLGTALQKLLQRFESASDLALYAIAVIDHVFMTAIFIFTHRFT